MNRNSDQWFRLNFSGEEINELLEQVENLDAAIQSLNYKLDLKAGKDELFSKRYADLIGKPEIPSIEGLASEEFVIAKIEEAGLQSGGSGGNNDNVNVDLTGYAKIEDVEAVDQKVADNKNLIDAHKADKNVHVNAAEKEVWNKKFEMPTDGLAESYLDKALQTKLNKMAVKDDIINKYNGMIKEELIPAVDNSAYLEKEVHNAFVKDQFKPHVANETHITAKEREAWNAKYEKPVTGIPAADLEKEIAAKINAAVIKEDVLDDYAMIKKDVLPFDMKIVNGNLRLTIDGVTKIFVPTEGINYDDIGFRNNIVYGYYMGRGVTLDPKNISVRELEEATTVMNKAPLEAMGKTSIFPGGACPQAATYFVILPADCELNVTRDNGIGGKVPFDESVLSGDLKFGCNCVETELNGVPVKVWGQFMMAGIQMFMYVD